MAKQSIVPFGPQHPVLPEPVHLDLVLEDEVVVKAVPSIGFVHRGLEKLVETKDYKEYVYIAERVCGICSFGHGLGYCQCLEKIMNVEIPPRAAYLRTIWMEMSRIHSHLLWLGLLADAMGFESLFMQSWKLREQILDMFDMTTGGRVIFSVNCVGGVLKDMDDTMLKTLVRTVNDMAQELLPVTEAFLRDYTVGTRLHGLGVLSAEDARMLWDPCCALRGWNTMSASWAMRLTATWSLSRSPHRTAIPLPGARCASRRSSSPLT